MSMGKLLICRHTESEWNALGKWTGTTDVHLSENGFHQAGQVGEALKDVDIDFAYCSLQIRTKETLEGILDGSGNIDVDYERIGDINERDYGDYTGMNKWEVRDKVGEAEFDGIRRAWDHPVPNGETLKIVFERTIPFYKNVVLPRLQKGETILMVAHGNSLRALIKYMENTSDEDIKNVEMPFGTVYEYEVDEEGKSLNKKVIKIEMVAPHA